MKKSTNEPVNPRLGKVGGQAVLEGVMMKAGERTVTTCRKEDGTLAVTESDFVSIRKKHKILDLPLVRGVVNLVEMMKLSMQTLETSADALGIEEEDGKAEKWLRKHLGISLTNVIMTIGMILGIALALLLFMFLPSLIADLLVPLFGGGSALAESLVEGVAKVIIFLVYLGLISLMPDIKRVFMYHGAEHKSIACFEAGASLTPENAKNYTRFHPRCGTSFMFFMILIGIVAGLCVRLILPNLPTYAYVLIRLAILPLVVGIGYEFIMYAGKHDNIFTRTLSAPGLWVQRLTTKEPDASMLECAITSLKCAMRDQVPEFMEFYLARPWEETPVKEPADGDTAVGESAASHLEAETPPTDTAPDTAAESAEDDVTASAGGNPDSAERIAAEATGESDTADTPVDKTA